jgi:hypothetical protein
MTMPAPKENPASTLIERGARLPPLQLLSKNGNVLNLDAPELGSPALLFVRDRALEVARPYITSWEEHFEDLRGWYGRPLLITETAEPNSSLPHAHIAADQWSTLGIEPEACALIIADRWGLVYDSRQTVDFSDLPNVAEVEEWLRFLATQCPECGVPDEPGYGEWAP